MTAFDYDWKPTSNMPHFDVGFAVTNLITHIIKTQLPEYLIYFPFQGRFNFEHYFKESIALFKLTSLTGTGVPSIGEIKDDGLIQNVAKIVTTNPFPDFDSVNRSNPEFFSFETFTYIGSQNDLTFSWRHLEEFVISYLNTHVLPQVMELNKKRVLSVIPTPPSYDIQKIVNNIFVIETPSVATQGSCFYLKDFGLVTCAHCIAEDSFIYRATDIASKYPIKIIKKNDVVDLAVFSADNFEYPEGLDIGNSDLVALNEHVAVAGFPNHNFGDTGIFSPGLVVGFRIVSSIRRLLLNTPLIAGNSGGPIVSKDSKVIGIVVTGADKMENASETENHGVIPIAALHLI